MPTRTFMQYHLHLADGTRLADKSFADIQSAVADGSLKVDGALAWTPGMPAWVPLSQVLGLPPTMPAGAPVYSGDGLGSLIPVKNSKALTAYYCAIFGLIPCVTFILGPLALIMGILGLKAVKRNPALPGTVHAWVGIILGGLETLVILLWLVFVIIAFVAGATRAAHH